MKQSIFSFKELTTWDLVSALLYVIITVLVWNYFDGEAERESREKCLGFYALGTQLFLYNFNYVSLRNLWMVFFWVIVGIIHFCFYLLLKESSHGSPAMAHALRNTIFLLALFQLLQIISAKTQRQLLVCPFRSYSMDLFEERRVTWMDTILMIVYNLSVFILLFVGL